MSGESGVIASPAWDNKFSEAARCGNTERPLTHSLDSTEEGLAMQATRPCAADGCDTPAYCKGWCSKHYQRVHKYGSPDRGRLTILDRLPSLVDVAPFGCWLWRGYKDENGYGRCSITKFNTQLAHRVVYMTLVGVDEADLLPLDHLCRTPSCVNPDHLEPVSLSVNTQRGLAPNILRARAAAITQCPRNHEYTPENTNYNNKGARVCRACTSLRMKKWRAARRHARIDVGRTIVATERTLAGVSI